MEVLSPERKKEMPNALRTQHSALIFMDCRNFKDLLDSYLSAELAVETNHAILRHTENCPPCRAELAGRRQLREALQRACTQEKMSEEACERLRARLRAEAAGKKTSSGFGVLEWLKKAWAGLSARPQWSLPLALTTATLLMIGGVSLLRSAAVAELNAALIDQAVGDHRTCATKFINASGLPAMPKSAEKDDRAYLDLPDAARAGAEGLQLRAAHVCSFGGRRFAHLVYTPATKESQLISLLVTQRDAQAVKSGQLPSDAGNQGDWTHFFRDSDPEHLALGAYQTARHVVIVVSDLPEAENRNLARRLGTPVVDHLRQAEQTAQLFQPVQWSVVVNLSRQEAGGRKQ